MSESRDHKCPRCGTHLPTVTVRVPVYLDHMHFKDGVIVENRILARYEEVEEVAECVRCTGAY